MFRNVTYLLLLFVLFSCTSSESNPSIKKTNVVAIKDSISEKTNSLNQPNSSLNDSSKETIAVFSTKTLLPQNKFTDKNPHRDRFIYGDDYTYQPGIAVEQTYLYDFRKNDTVLLDTLTFLDPISLVAETGTHFLAATPKGTIGYIRRDAVYFHKLWSGHTIGITEYGTLAGDLCGTSKLRIQKLDADNSLSYTYSDSIEGKDYSIEVIYNSTLKKVKNIIHLNYHCYQGIGSNYEHFIVDNGKLSQLAIMFSSGDGGYSDHSDIYLPIRLTNGKKVVLAKNGKITANSVTGKTEVHDYPKDCGIPIENLVVIETYTIGDVPEEYRNHSEYNKDGTQFIYKNDVVSTLYQWDGEQLKKIKQITNN